MLTLLTETYPDGSNYKWWECQWVLCLRRETLKESKYLLRRIRWDFIFFFRRYEAGFFLCFNQILCLTCWACQSNTVYPSHNISMLWFLLPHMAQYDLNDSFAENTDHTTITTAVHMRKYMKDQKRIMSALRSLILWKLSLPNT